MINGRRLHVKTAKEILSKLVKMEMQAIVKVIMIIMVTPSRGLTMTAVKDGALTSTAALVSCF